MSEGTISVLLGCHSVSHSIMVMLSWKKLYGKWPKLWELICILLHDVGHLGKNYLSNEEDKQSHWIMGAIIAYYLVGSKGLYMVAGHCPYYSGINKSKLFLADKFAWCITPNIILYFNTIIEPKLKAGRSIKEHVKLFKNKMIENMLSPEPIESHRVYINMNKGNDKNV